MTTTELIEALATALRAYATAPLSDCEVHAFTQLGYEDTDGAVTIEVDSITQEHIAIGDDPQCISERAEMTILGIVPWADTAANYQKIDNLQRQIVHVLRLNRQVTGAGGDSATTNARQPITARFGYYGRERTTHRTCSVSVSYDYTPETAA